MKKLTLMQIWTQHASPLFSYLIVENEKGERVHIDGYRQPDPEGGCMATGTPGELFGHLPSGDFWFNSPPGYKENSSTWTFIQGYSEEFYVRGLASGRVIRGIEEKEHSFIVLEKGQKVHYNKASFERIPANTLCQGCLHDLQPKKSLLQRLFG